MVEAGNRPQSADVDNDVTVNASSGAGAADGGTLLAESVLDRRYRLIGVLSSRGPVTLWRGDDTVLTRPVAVRVVEHVDDDPARHEAAQSLLSAAVNSGRLVHPGAASTYDATVTTTDNGQVSYVITEWVDGRTLRQLAQEGPLRPEQASAVVLGAARVIAAAHERGLRHGGLRPGDVIVSSHGTVKVIDLEVGAVLATIDGTGPTESEDRAGTEAADVRALGGLLYAALTGSWPLSGDTGLPPASYGTYGRLQSPRQLNHAVPRDLDAITMAALSGDESAGEPITTATDLIAELEAVTPVEALHDTGLMTFGDEPPGTEAMMPGYGGPDGYGPDTASLPSTAGFATPGRDDYGRGGYDDGGYRGGRYQDDYDDGYDRGRRGGGYDDNGYPPQQRGYPPAGTGGQRPRSGQAPVNRQQPRRRALPIIIAIVVVAILTAGIVLALQLGGGDGDNTADGPISSPTATAGSALTPAGVISYDPLTGDPDKKENEDTVGNAIDGNPSTQWTTQSYKSAAFGGLKSGVGFRVSFAEPVHPSSVVVTVGSLGPVTFELRAGDTESLDVNNAYPVVGQQVTGQANEDVPVQIPAGTSAKYWVLWITQLPPDGFKASIADIKFLS
ncbi:MULTISPECIES: protein kinase family protein [unclassified Pseudofrankia]|uniref:protein kinase family protein n=1 Tax=unclassified Pseudofrankia TaxID=2994372 RepID=UPI0008DA0DEB|nr:MULTISPECIES: protein kinase family protein [unclassified Pseudofrankia]MDT3444128.1 protein kinase family protein [Pseudofrankia sp. BMG5.37]OHV44442.1 serine/threonine protein kinase [Pseudofrankia sp. BMG5.36]